MYEKVRTEVKTKMEDEKDKRRIEESAGEGQVRTSSGRLTITPSIKTYANAHTHGYTHKHTDACLKGLFIMIMTIIVAVTIMITLIVMTQ